MKENLSTTDILTQFKELPVGKIMEIPLSILRPSTLDTGLSSESIGPIEVYSLRKKEKSGEIITGIWIADGNRRYFDHIRSARQEAIKAGIEFDPSKVLTEVKKIIPDLYHDIRFMFKTTDWFE